MSSTGAPDTETRDSYFVAEFGWHREQFSSHVGRELFLLDEQSAGIAGLSSMGYQ